MPCICAFFKVFLFTIALSKIASTQSTYKAAVVEFYPRLTAYSPQDLLLENSALFITYIEQAAEMGSQIIVFPEDGLTGLNLWKNPTLESISNYSTLVPNAKDEIAPCDDSSLQSYVKALVDLSCSARTNSIYVVVNVIEKALDTTSTNSSYLYFNTDVVFDRNGVVIAKYRKINLYYEPFMTAGNETVTFTTDFGVKFTLFTCFDILFKNPSVTVLSDSEVTDVIYPVAWFSEVPFLFSLSVQSAYARAHGVNLLASGLSDAANGNGGSGIYLANGTITETYMSAASASKMIIQDVPIWSKRPTISCNTSTSTVSSSVISDQTQRRLSTFKLLVEDLSNYTTQSLDLSVNSTSTTICSEGSSFCCNFNIDIDLNTVNNSNVIYKLIAFNGNRKLGEISTGNQVCGIVACLSDDVSSCGLRRPFEQLTGIKFNSINISGNFVEAPSEGYTIPSTLTFSLDPMQHYIYCRNNEDYGAQVYMNLTAPNDSIFAFGIFGRIFNNDGKPVGKSTATLNIMRKYSVFFLTVLTVLQQKILS